MVCYAVSPGLLCLELYGEWLLSGLSFCLLTALRVPEKGSL